VLYNPKTLYYQHVVKLPGWQPGWSDREIMALSDDQLDELGDRIYRAGYKGSNWQRGDFVDVVNFSQSKPGTVRGLFVVDIDDRGWYLRALERQRNGAYAVPRDYRPFSEFYPAFQFYLEPQGGEPMAGWISPDVKEPKDMFLVWLTPWPSLVRNEGVGSSKYSFSWIEAGRCLFIYPSSYRLDKPALTFYTEKGKENGVLGYRSDWMRGLLRDDVFLKHFEDKLLPSPALKQIFVLPL
jgi:hypothetical protein